MAVAQPATQTLFSAALWMGAERTGSKSSPYQRSDRPGGGKRSACVVVKEVAMTMRTGATRMRMATAAMIPTTRLKETSAGVERCDMGGL